MRSKSETTCPFQTQKITIGPMYILKQNAKALRATPKISLIVAFYNSFPLLEMVFAALKTQTFHDFEVLICDDGSNEACVNKIHALMEQFSFPVSHLWHEDRGFRKNRILNWGLFHAQSDIITIIDQDCIPHPEFLREHYENFEVGQVLCGRRMEFSPWVTSKITPKRIESGYIQRNLWWMLIACAPYKDNNGKKGIYVRNKWLRQFLNRKYRGIVGCNFSVAKHHLLEINGFDYRYEGPGTGEDSDIEYRLSLHDIRMTSFANTAVQYHLYHPIKIRPSENEKIFAEVQAQAKAITDFGLRQQIYQNFDSRLTHLEDPLPSL